MMGEVGLFEVLLILLLGLLVLGPERMVRMARDMGHWYGRIRRLANNMRIVLADELDQVEQLRYSDGTLPGTGGAKRLSDIGKQENTIGGEAEPDPPDK